MEDQLYLFRSAHIQIFRMTSSKKILPLIGRSKTWAKDSWIWRREIGYRIRLADLGPERDEAAGGTTFVGACRFDRWTGNRKWPGAAWGWRRTGCRCPGPDRQRAVHSAFLLGFADENDAFGGGGIWRAVGLRHHLCAVSFRRPSEGSDSL